MGATTHKLEPRVFESAIENSLDNISILDLEGRVLFVNQAAVNAFEMDDASVVEGAKCLDFWPKTAGVEIQRGLEAARSGRTHRFEGRCPTARGVMKWWDIYIAPVRDADGLVTGIIATSRDITALRQARLEAQDRDLALASKAAALRSAFRVAHVGGWEIDFLKKESLFSEEVCDLLGVPLLPPTPLSESVKFWCEEDRIPFLNALDHVERMGERLAFQGRTLSDDGSFKTWRLFGEPVFEDGRCVGLRGAAQETTEMNEVLERERHAIQAADAMSRFLATMSHELRTPLNGVLGMAQAMARGELPPAQRERLGVIECSGQALLSLLNDLLDLAKIESGKVELERGVVDTQALADGAQSLFTAMIQGKTIGFELELTPAARGCWTGDPTRVRQVLHNLISNAVKFTDHGSIKVRIGYEDASLVLRVEDTGIGIPAGKLTEVFDRFVQADASTTRRFGGSGLGLTICRDLLVLMGGDIQAESAEGVGTTFVARIPALALASASADQDSADGVQEGLSPVLGLRVLAAEDNLTNQVVLKTLLAEVGIEPTFVVNGQQAVEAWIAEDWDLVLMDIQMPVMDGLSAVRSIRRTERQQGLRRTPVIAVTANTMARHQAEYLAAGMDAVVAKPIDFSGLLATMDAVLAANEESESQACHA